MTSPIPNETSGASSDRQRFVDEHSPPELIADLERRMRPRAYSDAGFLGRSESLLARLRADDAWLRQQGITHAQIADRLETVLRVAQRRYMLAVIQQDRRVGPEIPEFVIVYGRIEVAITVFNGSQECPFELKGCMRGSCDFDVRRRESQNAILIPELAIHLIRDHHFFEGETPYRVDPAAIVDLLEIRPNVSYAPETLTEEVWDWHSYAPIESDLITEIGRTADCKIELEGATAYRVADELVIVAREDVPAGKLPPFDGAKIEAWLRDGIYRFRKGVETYHVETPWAGVE